MFFLLLQNIDDLVVDLKSLATAAKAYHEAMQSKCYENSNKERMSFFPPPNLQNVRSWEGV